MKHAPPLHTLACINVFGANELEYFKPSIHWQTFICKLQVSQSLDKFAVSVYTMKLQETLQNFCLVKLVKFVLTLWRGKGDCVWLLQQ